MECGHRQGSIHSNAYRRARGGRGGGWLLRDTTSPKQLKKCLSPGGGGPGCFAVLHLVQLKKMLIP